MSRRRDDPVLAAFERYIALTPEQQRAFSAHVAGYGYSQTVEKANEAWISRQTRKPGRPAGSKSKQKDAPATAEGVAV